MVETIYCEGCGDITDTPTTFAVAGTALFRGHYDCAPKIYRDAIAAGSPLLPPPMMRPSTEPIVFSHPDPWSRA